jgi:type VI secretion system ImpC/EvpB family protein
MTATSEALIEQWLGPPSERQLPDVRRRVARQLTRAIADIDELLNRQVNAILHNPAFQRLEASWRGLQYLVEQVPEGANVKVRILSVTWRELVKDLERALEFDQSNLFRKIYNEEFGMPGGEPYGVILSDYEMYPRPGPGHPTDDIGALEKISNVAAAAFAPFVAGVAPSFLDLGNFTELDIVQNLPRTFEQPEYLKWRSLRDTEDSRFIGLLLPRVLARVPYNSSPGRTDRFVFHEDVSAPDCSDYLWTTPVWAFGSVLVRAFAESGWFAATRGTPRDVEGGGLVTELPVHSFQPNPTGTSPRTSTDTAITDRREKELSELGFIALCACQDTSLSAFFGSSSIQRPKNYDDPVATANARLSSQLQYILCVSRFSHYLKVIARDKVGSFATPSDCEESLKRWIQQYITGNDSGGPELKAKYPLREAKIQVREQAGKPGSYVCVAHLRPHFQLEHLTASIKLVTELNPARQA